MTVSGASPSARAAVAGLLADRESNYLAEYTALVEAAFAVTARTGVVEPRVADIVAEAGLSNQVFYRHFASKDDLMLAVLEDGRYRLVEHLEDRTARASTPVAAVDAWIRGVMAQARDSDAAARSRPFAVHGDRLAARFPDVQSESIERLRDLLAGAVRDGVTEGALPDSALRMVDLVFWMTFDALKRGLLSATAPVRADVDDLVRFCLDGLGTVDHG